MMSDDEDMDCPLCMEEFDIADRNFRPCPCAYQICRFCWHHIKTNLNGRCPACRRVYSDQIVEFIPVSAEEIQKSKREKKEKERHERDMKDPNRRQLSNVRVVQKNLVYVLGLGSKYANAENDFFKKYGKILKLVVSKRPPTSTGTSASIGIYVTYARKEDAAKAIEEINGAVCDGKSVRASFGTTKYCTYFLRHMSCPNPNCMYLHEAGDDADSYNNETPTVGTKHGHSGATGYTYPNKRPAASTSTTTSTSASTIPSSARSALTTSNSETVLQPAPPPIKSAWAPLPKVTPPPPPPAPASVPEPEPVSAPASSNAPHSPSAKVAATTDHDRPASPSSSKLGGKQNQHQQASSSSKSISKASSSSPSSSSSTSAAAAATASTTPKKHHSPVSLLSASLSQQKQKQVDSQDHHTKPSLAATNKENEKPALPATASWAKGGSQNTQSASLTPDHFGPSLSDALTTPQKPKHESSSLPSVSTSRKKDKKKAKMVSLKTFEELTRQSPTTTKSPLSSSPLNAALRGDVKVDADANNSNKEPVTKSAWGTLPAIPTTATKTPVSTETKQPTTVSPPVAMETPKQQLPTTDDATPATEDSTSDGEAVDIIMEAPQPATETKTLEPVDHNVTQKDSVAATTDETAVAPTRDEPTEDSQQHAPIDENITEIANVDDKVVSEGSLVDEQHVLDNNHSPEPVEQENEKDDTLVIDDSLENPNSDELAPDDGQHNNMMDPNVLDIMFADDVLGSVMTDDLVEDDSNSDFASDNDEIIKAFDMIGQQQQQQSLNSSSPPTSEKIQQQQQQSMSTPTMVNASPSLFSLAQPMHGPIPPFLSDMQQQQNLSRRGLQGPPPGFPPPPPGWLPRNFDLFQGQDPALIAARRLQHSQQMLEASGLYGFGARPPHPHSHQPPPPPPPAPFNFSPDFRFASGGHPPPPPPPPPGMFSTPPPHIARPNMMSHPTPPPPQQQQQQPMMQPPPLPPQPQPPSSSSSSPPLSSQHDLTRLRSEFNQMHLSPASSSDSLKALPHSPSSSSLHQLASPSFAASSPHQPFMDHHQYQPPPPPSQQQPPPPQNGEYQLRNDLRAMLPNASISFGGGVGPMGNMMNNRDHHPPPHSRPQQQQAMPPPPGFQQDQQQMLQRPDRRQEAQHFFGEFLKNAATHTTEKEHGQEGTVPFHDPAIMSARVAEREKEMESNRSSLGHFNGAAPENGFPAMMRPPPFGISPQQQHLQTLQQQHWQQQQQQNVPRGMMMPPPGLFDRLPSGMMPPDMKQQQQLSPDPFMHRPPPPPPGLFGMSPHQHAQHQQHLLFQQQQQHQQQQQQQQHQQNQHHQPPYPPPF
ncbi:hypothetical protein [Absidia glauca]|uniref:RING-type domain-containing protein n=1 Tax=Absidia glauca TaxID=4829 RepID=A0A168MXY3_ABSGL|nr:hypothetical protein [Absidia glauca]